MFRAVRQGDKWYVIEIAALDADEIENIRTFIDEGAPVLLVEAFADIEEVLPDEEIVFVEDEGED